MVAGTANITYTATNSCGSNFSKLLLTATTPREGEGPGVTGVKEVLSFGLYPNPTNGSYTINTTAAGRFSIFGIDGRVVDEFEITENISQHTLPAGLPNGIYMCKFRTTDGEDHLMRLIYTE